MFTPEKYKYVNPKIIEIVKDDPFFQKFFRGDVSEDSMVEYLSQNRKILESKGLNGDLLNEFWDLFIHNEQKRNLIGHNRFAHLMHKLHIDIATPSEKVDLIKRTSFVKFLDILSISNGLLRDVFRFQRWKDINEDKSFGMILSANFTTDLWPPENSRFLFRNIYEKMQREISIHNMDYWAVMIYFAIVASHMFIDGNGRTARNAYYIIRHNVGILDEEKSQHRAKGIQELCEDINRAAIIQMCNRINSSRKIGLVDKNFLEIDNTAEYSGEFDFLFYVALKDAVKKAEPNLWTDNIDSSKRVGMAKMPPNIKKYYDERMKELRIEWFNEFMSVVNDCWKDAKVKLDSMIITQ